ncbi:C4-dicarboxylate transporter/malic acid transport protein [Catenulispora acidiphila DSM 44928]|uniref:C4-dicarboxylate transporter/malic acid transport protein n=1 Tax=Catenulispora acidiphila (strain DSM 44928 / JCM 14897 / NBRC 102108 / NRRL B-24433 / ID139908) TaxID=479433 RepID=C7QDN7_CATAD|nr:tellurite resistance/C4-dicarboxylate transporter family protein [Catenulispora acidiphila]ACU74661.1 C4-dicarboxylate transporter/malic acid transport protein [Catenulispora acidiphila DSM 44928]
MISRSSRPEQALNARTKRPTDSDSPAEAHGSASPTTASAATSPDRVSRPPDTSDPTGATGSSSPTTASAASSPASPGNSAGATAASTAASPTPTPASTSTNPLANVLSWFAAQPPAAGSAVMATGIVSIGLRQVGAQVLSVVALVLAVLLWLALADDFGRRLVWQRGRWVSEAQTPPALTAVAATTVLGVRFTLAGWLAVAVGLLVVAAVLWPLLLWAVVRRLRPHMPGAVFLICVATQGLVALGAALAVALPARWLLGPALVLFVFGLVLYVDALAHFDFGAVRSGAGDHWVAGGALAISALANAKLTEAEGGSGGLHSTLRVTALVLLALAWVWYAVLAASEIRWPRLRYDVRRWATIFPMGMTGAATDEVAKASGWTWLTTPGHVLVWIAAAAWLVVFAGLLREAAKTTSQSGASQSGTSQPHPPT